MVMLWMYVLKSVAHTECGANWARFCMEKCLPWIHAFADAVTEWLIITRPQLSKGYKERNEKDIE